jgi:hypothetical protein
MTAAYSWGLAGSVAVWAAVGLAFRMLIDPRSSLVAPVRRAYAWLDTRSATRVLQIVAVVSLLVSVVVGFRQYELTNCVAHYNEVNNVSQRARAEAADTDRQAQDTLFRQIADDPQHAFDKLRAYNASRAAADAQRSSNPIPPPPSQTCG